MNTQTHIVYRNRMEHDFYESGMLVPLLGGLGVGLLVFLVLIAVAGKVLDKHFRMWANWMMGASAVVSLCVGWLVLKWLLI